jgi:hypothetical protein
MTSRLLVFGRLAHDSEGILAAIYRLALVARKQHAKLPFGLLFVGQIGLKLFIAGFADANHGRRVAFYDPKFSLCHDHSLAHLAGRT